MKNHKMMFAALLVGLAALGLTMAKLSPSRVSAAQGPDPVFVTNTGGSQAIPITGNVSVTGTPTVALAFGSQVQIANDGNTPLPIRDVDRPTAQPFNYHVRAVWNVGVAFANADAQEKFTVPDGKRLVIEFVSLQAQVPPGGNVPFARLDTIGAGGIVLTVTHAGADAQSNEIFTATHRVFTILEPGAVVVPTAFCLVSCTTTTGSQGLIISVSGYLVDKI
jgi:hypothetical protein